MKVACLCPTAWRPRLLANAIACFQRQDWPREERRLFVLDDSGEAHAQSGEGWELHTMAGPAESLPWKYNQLLCRAIAWGADIVAVWEDDDIYLPWHLTAAVDAMERSQCEWSHCGVAWSLYTGRLALEDARGRFHAQLVARCRAVERCGGWPATKRADYDQTFLDKLYRECGPPADPCQLGWRPSYVFRWGSTQAIHAQAYMRGAEDEAWYRSAWLAGRRFSPNSWRYGPVKPILDREMKGILKELNRSKS